MTTPLEWRKGRTTLHFTDGPAEVSCLSLFGVGAPTGITITTSPDGPHRPKYGTLNVYGYSAFEPKGDAKGSKVSRLAGAKAAGEHMGLVLLAWECSTLAELEARWKAIWPNEADMLVELRAVDPFWSERSAVTRQKLRVHPDLNRPMITVAEATLASAKREGERVEAGRGNAGLWLYLAEQAVACAEDTDGSKAVRARAARLLKAAAVELQRAQAAQVGAEASA